MARQHWITRLIVIMLSAMMLLSGSGMSVLAESGPAVDADKASTEQSVVQDEYTQTIDQGSEDADVNDEDVTDTEDELNEDEVNTEDEADTENEVTGDVAVDGEEGEATEGLADETADVETAADWEATLPEELSTDIRKAVVQVAGSQAGYKESADNFIETEDGKINSYSRYSAFMEEEYADPWDADLVMFALYYAGAIDIDYPSIPLDTDSGRWFKTLRNSKLTREIGTDEGGSEQMPEAGDIIFTGSAADLTDTKAAVMVKNTGDALVVIGVKTEGGRDMVAKFTVKAEDVVGFVSLEDIAANMDTEDEEKSAGVEAAADLGAVADDIEAAASAAAEEAEEGLAAAPGLVLAEQSLDADLVAAPGIDGKLRSFFGSDKNAKITLTGMLPEDATVKAYPVKVKIPDQNVLAAYDITIYVPEYDENGEPTGKEVEWQPEEPLSVSITDKDLRAANKDSKVDFESLNVFHMKNVESEPEMVNEVAADDGTVTFNADSFSIYAVTEDGPEIYIFQFYNGTELVQSQKIKKGDVLYEPSTPTYTEGTGERFIGWYYEEDQEQNLLDFTNSPAYGGCVLTIDPIPADFADTEDPHVIKIQAKSGSYFYATFYDDTGYSEEGHGNPAVFTVREVAAGGSFDLSKVTLTPQDNNHVFAGWTETKGGNVAIDPSTIILTENKSFYPVIRPGHRISFDNNVSDSNTTYWPPVIVESGKTVRWGLKATGNEVYQDSPKRPGYVFGGWYTDQACTAGNEYDIEIGVPDGDMTLFAKWNNVTQATYSVNFWRQKVTDDKNAADSAKTYDFVKTEIRNAVAGTGENAGKWYGSLTSEDIGYGGRGDYKGFHYNKVNSASERAGVQIEVPATSTGVLNVYYDRDLMHYDFRAAIRKLTDGTKPAWSNETLGMPTYVYQNLLKRTATAEQSRTWISEIITEIPDGGYYTGLYGQSFEQAGYPDGWPEKIECVYTTETGTLSWTQRLVIFVWAPLTPSNYVPPSNTIRTTTTRGTIDVRSYIEAAPNENSSISFKDIFDINYTFGNANVGAASIALNHYAQDLNGNYSSSPTHSTSFSLPNEGSKFTVSPKFSGFVPDYYIIKRQGQSDLRVEYENDDVIKGDEYEGYITSVNVYHARNKHDIRFYNGSTEYTSYKKSDVFYLAPLNDGSITYPKPTKKGYTFRGWYTDEALTKPFDETDDTLTMPDADLRLFAKFEANKYAVHIDYDPDNLGAVYNSSRYFLVNHGERLVSERQTAALTGADGKGGHLPEGYEFLGWYIDGGTDQWISGDTVEEEDCHSKFLPDPSDPETMDPRNEPYYNTPMLTLTAKYRLESRMQVEYVAEGSSGVPTDNNLYYSDSEIVIAGAPTTLPTNKEFIGWADKNNHIHRPGEVVNLSELMVQDADDNTKVILTAVYASGVPQTYLVYEANGGTGEMAEGGPYEFNAQLDLAENSFVYEGYRFMGWSKTQNDLFNDSAAARAAVDFADKAPVGVENMGPLTLDEDGKYRNHIYAVWAKEYTVTYVVKSTVGEENAQNLPSPEDNDKYLSGDTVTTKAEPEVPTGYRADSFAGWTYSDTTVEPGNTFEIQASDTSELVLNGTWDPIEYTVKFNANGGTGTMEDQAFRYDVEQTLRKNTFNRENYEFLGWSTEAGAKTVTYIDEAPARNLAENDDDTVTLYAVWKANKCKLTVTNTIDMTKEYSVSTDKFDVTVTLSKGDETVIEDAEIPTVAGVDAVRSDDGKSVSYEKLLGDSETIEIEFPVDWLYSVSEDSNGYDDVKYKIGDEEPTATAPANIELKADTIVTIINGRTGESIVPSGIEGSRSLVLVIVGLIAVGAAWLSIKSRRRRATY